MRMRLRLKIAHYIISIAVFTHPLRVRCVVRRHANCTGQLSMRKTYAETHHFQLESIRKRTCKRMSMNTQQTHPFSRMAIASATQTQQLTRTLMLYIDHCRIYHWGTGRLTAPKQWTIHRHIFRTHRRPSFSLISRVTCNTNKLNFVITIFLEKIHTGAFSATLLHLAS